MTTSGYTYDDHLPADFSDQSLRADVSTGLTAAAKVAAAQVVLRQGRQRTVRGHHPAAGVLPDPDRASDPRPARRRDRRAAGTDTLIELGLGLVGEDPPAAGRDSTARAPDRRSYVALDVSEDALRSACAGLVAAYPRLRVGALRADFTHQLDLLPRGGAADGRVPRQHHRQLRAGRARRRSCGRCGPASARATASCSAPTWSSRRTCWCPAYDDAAGVTAAFNLNLLDVLNQRLDADFDRTAFEHVAVWDAENEWIEMRLRATRDVVAQVPGVGLTVRHRGANPSGRRSPPSSAAPA